MVDGAPGYDGAASDPPCYNCGMRGHWFNACPEPARKLPAGLEASLAARQSTRDGPASDSQMSSRRGKGPIITRYPLPPSPVPGLSRYDTPGGLPSHPQPPPPTSYAPPGPYGQPYAPQYHAPGHHHDSYGHGGPPPPPPPPIPSHYHQYHQYHQHPYAHGSHPHSYPSYPSSHDSTGSHHDNYGRPRSSQPHHYDGTHGHEPPPRHYSYPPEYDYPRHSPPYSNTPPMSFHGSPPPDYRHAHYPPPPPPPPPPHHHNGHGRDRSPRGQSRDHWQSRSYRQHEDEHQYRDREHERGRPRYSPHRQSPPQQRYERERSPQRSRPPLRDGPPRHDRRRDKRGSVGNARKSEKDRGKQGHPKSADKPGTKPARFEKSQPAGHAQAAVPKPTPKPDLVVQWGLVVPYLPVWDFEGDGEEDEPGKTMTGEADQDVPYEEDQDLEWSNSQLFAEWVPMIQSRAICKPLPHGYSEADIASPAGYDTILQTKHITPHNVDQFSMGIRETKEWRHKRELPMFADPMEIHPRMLAQLGNRDRKGKDEKSARDGRNQQQKKANGHQHESKTSQDNEAGKASRRHQQEETRHLSNDKNQHGRSGDYNSSGKMESPVLNRREPENNQKHRCESQPKNLGNSQGKPSHNLSHGSPAQDLPRLDIDQRTDHERRLNAEAASTVQETSHQRIGSDASKTSSHDPAHDSKQDGQSTGDVVGPDTSSRPLEIKGHEFLDGAKVFSDHERPFSRDSLRSWHSKSGRNSRPLSRRTSNVSDMSRPESPLTPTEMALLGIDMDSDSNSEHVMGDGPEPVIVTKVPEMKQKRQDPENEINLTPKGGRLGKRQATATASEEVTPRTKKRRQQVASAFSRRW